MQTQPLPSEVVQALWNRPDFLPTLVELQKTLCVDFFVQSFCLRLVKNDVEASVMNDEEAVSLRNFLKTDVELASGVKTAMAREVFKSFKK